MFSDQFLAKLILPAIIFILAILIIKRREKRSEKKETKYPCLIPFVVIVGVSTIFSGWEMISYLKDIQCHKSIVNETLPLVNDCNKLNISDESRFTFRGKCIIWDVKNNERTWDFHSLPSSLKARSREEDITVFLLLEVEDIQVGTYSISNQAAYQKRLKLCAVSWPDKSPIGVYYVWGKEPRVKRAVIRVAEYEGTFESLAKWVSGHAAI